MEPEAPRPGPRYREIDLLRFLAALAVVLYHYTFLGFRLHRGITVQYGGLEPVSKYGYLGVELFFIISGYVVLLTAYGKTIRQFFVARVARLYPAFWVACTLSFLLVHFFAPRAGEAGWSPAWSISPARYVFNMTMLEEFFGVDTLDGPYWTLTYELTFYFLISLVIGYGLLRRLDLVLVGWLLYTAFSGPAPAVQSAFFKLLMPDYSPFFMAGILFFLLQKQLFAPWKLYGLLAGTFGLALRSEYAFTAQASARYHSPLSFAVVAGAITVFFVLLWLIALRKINLERYGWLSALGALTYPLYLLHSNIGYLAFVKLEFVLNKYLLLVGLVGLMLLASYALHRGVERPLGHRINHLLHRLLKRLAA